MAVRSDDWIKNEVREQESPEDAKAMEPLMRRYIGAWRSIFAASLRK